METLNRRLKALADPIRLQILHLLRRDLSVGALARKLNLSEGGVSQHLRILRQEGFIRGEKRGYWTHYQVDDSAIRAVAVELLALADAVSETALPSAPSNGCQ